MSGAPSAPPPIPYLALKDIVHGSSVLSSLVSATTPTDSSQPPYKFSVHSTTIQDFASTPSASASTSTRPNDSSSTSSSKSTAIADSQPRPPSKEVGRRGMHAAAAGYWDNIRDGMWSYKYEAAASKGLDVMVAVVWIWVGYPGSAGPGGSASDDAPSAAPPE